MIALKNKIEDFKEEVTFQSLKSFIQSLDIDDIEYEEHVLMPEKKGDYGRNIFTFEPFECVLINWPPLAESAVHHHQGLFGYVWVLEGELDNVFYKEEDGNLIEFSIDKFVKNGLIPEADGVIHKLANSSTSKRAITLHFYYPALKSFEGMRIFNLASGDEGILSEKATTASWSEEDDVHFEKINRNAVNYISYEELNRKKSHVISNVIPKPEAERINEMNGEYFCEQAEKYDFSDFNHPDRKTYTSVVDELIAEDLKKCATTSKHLDVATGTGRRALNIKSKSGLDYEIVGVDISEEMCKIAESRGIRTYHQDWANDDTHTGEVFDSATFLYAFGHIPTEKLRIKTLKKINSYLSKGGVLYIDLFSISNKNEWGPLAIEAFNRKNLQEYGYKKGDVFYKKIGLDHIAFLHYFSLEEIKELFKVTGFEVVWIKNIGYSKNPGKIVESGDEGNYFIKAKKI